MRVAICHDWLTGMRGGERCLEIFCDIFPDSEIFCLFGNSSKVTAKISSRRVTYSFLQKVPGLMRFYRYLLPVFPLALSDLEKKLLKRHREAPFDLVLSISHCAVKNMASPEGVMHICYCLTPMRYIWDQYHVYFSNSILEPLIRRVAYHLRRWDVEKSGNVDQFIGISRFVQDRIRRIYGRKSSLVYPPVSNSWLPLAKGAPENKFICVSAFVPYKNVDVVIEAFNELKLPLTVVGKGPEEKKLRSIAGPNISFKCGLSDEQLSNLYRSCRALVFAAEEDFGMVPVEVQFSGRPVIALARGGSVETVTTSKGKQSGVLFARPKKESIVEAVKYFIEHEGDCSIANCYAQAKNFSLDQFYESLNVALEESGVGVLVGNRSSDSLADQNLKLKGL